MNNQELNKIVRKYADTFRMNYELQENVDTVQMDFGKFVDNKNVDVQASIEFPVGLLKELVVRAIILGQIYQKDTGKDLGFPEDEK